MVPRLTSGLLTAAVAVLLAFSCAEEPPGASPMKGGGDAGNDPDEDDTGKPDEFEYDEADEKELDEKEYKSAGDGMHVVTIYFTGGTAKKCARWDLEIKSPGIKIADANGLLKKDGKDKLAAKFVSRGAKPGVRVYAKTGENVAFIGKQTSCNRKDIIDFDVKVLVKELPKLKQLFEGFEEDGDGQSRLKVMVSTIKG